MSSAFVEAHSSQSARIVWALSVTWDTRGVDACDLVYSEFVNE
jgi:hypothetical protein